MDMSYLLLAVVVLGAIALVSSVVLYVCSRKFAVKEDGRIARVAAVLPQANCGGCGFAGCNGLAAALVKGADQGSIDGLRCPVGGDAAMSQITSILGLAATQSEPKVAVVRCSGTCDMRTQIVQYTGLRTCLAMNMCGVGETACGYGCLGGGDCEQVCQFGAIKINPATGMPEVDEAKCTACGACAKACPRHSIELRNRGPRSRRVFVSCMNRDRGPAAMKACQLSCIGCGKCQKECKFDAITIENNLAYIDYTKCKLCRKCEKACPRHAIKAINFPAPKATQPAAANPQPQAKPIQPATEPQTAAQEAPNT